jgi:hypothetical protein
MQPQGILFHAFFALELFREQMTLLVELPGAAWSKETLSGWIRLALAFPLRGIVRALLTMTER